MKKIVFLTLLMFVLNMAVAFAMPDFEYLKYNGSRKVTSPRVGSTASKILRSGRYGKAAKSVAGSALSQRPSRR